MQQAGVDRTRPGLQFGQVGQAAGDPETQRRLAEYNPWLVPEIVALAAIIVGCVQIAKSPLAAETSGLATETASTVLLSL